MGRLIDIDAFRADHRMNGHCENCERDPRKCQYEYSYSLMDFCDMLVNATIVNEWISVKDRLPEKSGQYLCWFGANKVAIGPAIETYVDEWKAFGRLESLEKYPNITHWMPLPEPPKEG